MHTAQNSYATQSSSIFARFGAKYGVDGNKVSTLLKATAFKVRDGVVTDEQMAALLIVAEQFGLNPFLKEIYAFPDKKNGIVPVIGVDGWNRIANEHHKFDGCEFRYSENSIQIDEDAKACPEWVECVVYRKDRSRPFVVREYLEECYRAPFKGRDGSTGSWGPWQTHTKRFMRHKVFVQAIRMAFGFCGAYDEDEAERIIEARAVNVNTTTTAPIDMNAPLALTAGEQFEKVVLDLNLENRRQQVEQYVEVCANHFKTDTESVKAQIIQRPQEFAKTFPVWESNRKSLQNTQTSEPSANTVSHSKSEKFTEKTADKERINAETGEVTDHQTILDPGPPQDDQPEDAYGESAMTGDKIMCPKNNRLIDDWECAECKARDGCPSWDE